MDKKNGVIFKFVKNEVQNGVVNYQITIFDLEART